MANDGRYIFRNCVPDGSIDVINVEPGDIIKREWSFRVNAPVDVQEKLDAGEWDPRNVLTGKDGELYDENGNFLAEVNTFQAQINPENTDYQPAGQSLVWAVPTSYNITLTFTETVIKDRLITKILNGFKSKKTKVPALNFTGVLRG